MSEKRIMGVSSIEVGEIAVDGDVSAAFAALGGTYKDTATFEEDDGTDTEHEIEESDDPVEILPGPTKKTITWGIINMDPETLVKVLGGTVTGTGDTAKWNAPRSKPAIYLSVRITDKNGVKVTYPRCFIKAKRTWKVTKTGILQVIIKARVLTPTKDGVAPEIQG